MKHMTLILVVFVALLPAAASAEYSAKQIEASHVQIQRDLAEVARGLESGIQKNDVKVAEQLFRVEIATQKLLQASTAATKYSSSHHKRSTVSDIRSTMRMVLRLQERMLDHTIAELDRVLPGEPHRELWARQGVDLYRPLLRTSTPKPGQPKPSRSERITEMKQDSAEAKGKIHYLGPKTVKNYYQGQVFEWVQVGNRIRITDAGAKHPIIALEGKAALDPKKKSQPKSVRGAGSGMFIMGANGEPVMAIISDSSGNYKPGIGSTLGMVQKLESIGIPSRRIVITHVLPGEPIIYKLLLKSKLLPKEQLKAQVAALRTSAHSTPLLRSSKQRAANRVKAPGNNRVSRARPTSVARQFRAKQKQAAKPRARVRAR